MGRPPKLKSSEPAQRLNIRVPQSSYRRFGAEAKAKGLTLAELFVHLVNNHCMELPDQYGAIGYGEGRDRPR